MSIEPVGLWAEIPDTTGGQVTSRNVFYHERQKPAPLLKKYIQADRDVNQSLCKLRLSFFNSLNLCKKAKRIGVRGYGKCCKLTNNWWALHNKKGPSYNKQPPGCWSPQQQYRNQPGWISETRVMSCKPKHALRSHIKTRYKKTCPQVPGRTIQHCYKLNESPRVQPNGSRNNLKICVQILPICLSKLPRNKRRKTAAPVHQAARSTSMKDSVSCYYGRGRLWEVFWLMGRNMKAFSEVHMQRLKSWN